MDPQLSGFALGLLFGAAKIGAIGTIGFAIAWWRTRRKLQRLERALPDPGVLKEHLANLEQNSDYIGRNWQNSGRPRPGCYSSSARHPVLPSPHGAKAGHTSSDHAALTPL